MNAILDADSYAFRCAVVSEDVDLFIAAARLDEMINNTLDAVEAKEYALILSGKNNFRYGIRSDYKQNRDDKARPKWEQALKQHVIDQWEGITAEGMEGDDGCGIAQYETGCKSIICHQDKDLNQLEGWHYNFVKKEKYFITPEDGIRFFWYQMLVGDRIDNLPGIYGIGPKTADGILYEKTPVEMMQAVRELYPDDEEFESQAACFWILRHKGKTWKDYIEASIS
jgi:5'-3' exonuclease